MAAGAQWELATDLRAAPRLAQRLVARTQVLLASEGLLGFQPWEGSETQGVCAADGAQAAS